MTQLKRSPQKNIFNQTWNYKLFLVIARRLPFSAFRFIVRNMALLWCCIDRKTRNQVEGNLSRIVGKNYSKLRRISRELFVNYGVYLADWTKIIGFDTPELFSYFSKIEGMEFFEEARAKGNGLIILSVHLGNWEMGALVFTHLGIPFNVLTAKEEMAGIAQIRTRARALHNIKTITIDEGAFFFIDIVNALKRNEIVAMLVDRYEKDSGVPVDFFGEKTFFPRGPVSLARATGASLLPAFTVLEPSKKYRSVLGPPIHMEWSEDKERDICVNVAKIAHVFEDYIRLYPSQWFNFAAIWDR
jgi:KDO2-lipid IV(A) lauroyltransferase